AARSAGSKAPPDCGTKRAASGPPVSSLETRSPERVLRAELGAVRRSQCFDDRAAQPRGVVVGERALRRLERDGERNRLLAGRNLVAAVVREEQRFAQL